MHSSKIPPEITCFCCLPFTPWWGSALPRNAKQLEHISVWQAPEGMKAFEVAELEAKCTNKETPVKICQPFLRILPTVNVKALSITKEQWNKYYQNYHHFFPYSFSVHLFALFDPDVMHIFSPFGYYTPWLWLSLSAFHKPSPSSFFYPLPKQHQMKKIKNVSLNVFIWVSICCLSFVTHP